MNLEELLNEFTSPNVPGTNDSRLNLQNARKYVKGIQGPNGQEQRNFRSTTSSRRSLEQEKDLNAVKDALDYAYNYLIAAAKNTPLQNRMLQETNRLKRVMDKLINQNLKRIENKNSRKIT